MTFIAINQLKTIFDLFKDNRKSEPITSINNQLVAKYILDLKTEIKINIDENDILLTRDILKKYIKEIYKLILTKNDLGTKLTIEKSDSSEYIFLDNICTTLIDTIIYICFEIQLDFKYLCLDMKLNVSNINLKLYYQYMENLKIFDYNNSHSQLFPNVFSSNKAFELFLKFLSIINVSKNKLADVSFYYRKMYNDKLIIETCRAENFKKWLADNYKIEIIHSLKTYDNCVTSQREIIYKTIKDNFF